MSNIENMKKKSHLVIGLLLIIMLGLGCISNVPSQSEKDEEDVPTINAVPIIIPTIQETPLITADGCQKPSNGTYGGISRNESNPPEGTEISKELTEYYGRTTATGECGTYQYVSGWWFSDSEMEKLPLESIMYGTSPYAISSGSSTKHMGPIAPVPEPDTIILVSIGIFSIFVISRKL